MRNNITALIKDELVKRFEDVVKQEIASHNLAIQRSNKSLQDFRQALDDFAKNRDEIRKQNQQLHDQTRQQFVTEKENMEVSFDDQRRYLRDLSKKTKQEIEEIKKEIAEKATDEHLTEMSMALSVDYGRLRRRLDDRLSTVEGNCFEECRKQDYLNAEHKKYIEHRLQKIDEVIDAKKAEIEVAKTECAGVLKELQIYKKREFIVEKKIEHLYNQIERIKKNSVPNCS
ncbi:MAG: hypothetical protein KAS32_30550 [Candidatus Peribacteraceae bacterium]|nr:hypothetical protein [Candidatus Peribacteraceae bacterium]